MNILVVDDERKTREVIVQMIRNYCQGSFEIEEADSVGTALKTIRRRKPDLLLLDIQLKDGSGFSLLEELGNPELNVVFITAYEEYAIKACRASALDYLLKPVDVDELKDAIRKAQKRVEKDQLGTIIQNLKNEQKTIRKITLKTADSIYILNTNEIIYCQGSGNYTTFYLVDQRKILVSKPLGEYEELIGGSDFLRVHQSYMVNMNHILRYEKRDGGSIITIHNHSIPVSSRRKEQVMQFFNQL